MTSSCSNCASFIGEKNCYPYVRARLPETSSEPVSTHQYTWGQHSIGWRQVLVPCGHRFLLPEKREPNYRDYEQSHGRHSKELSHTTCSQEYEEDGTICFGEEDTVGKKYKEFAKEFPGWKDPKIKEESPLREYILATYKQRTCCKVWC